MRKFISIPIIFFSLTVATSQNAGLVVAFGSCDNEKLPNKLWDDVLAQKPSVWIWGGDNVYADTENMEKMAEAYQTQKQDSLYLKLSRQATIMGIWDDHDYGKNDAGVEWQMKNQAKQLLYNFLDIPTNSPLRKRAGTYQSYTMEGLGGKVKFILLDTRYFRDSLEKSPIKGRRYDPTKDTTKTLLGNAQWEWLEKELNHSDADFNVLVTSIQFLSRQHGFETWGNFPHETERMEKLIAKSGAKGVFFVSGDRHIAEWSRKEIDALSYPLVDFTSSGLTHVYEAFKGEENEYRVGKVTNKVNFGLLRFDFIEKKVHFELWGDGALLDSWEQEY